MENKSTTPFYVIERHLHSALNYWLAEECTANKADGWTTKIDKAAKFWDAETAAYMLTRFLDGIGNVVEHSYVETSNGR